MSPSTFTQQSDLPLARLARWAVIIALAHLVLWTIPALIWRTAAPMDAVEAFVYSLQWQWGYEKDPYLVTLFVMLARLLTDGHIGLTYFFSQFAILATFAAVWRFARVLGLPHLYALAAVLCLEGILYYNVATPEFNDNVLMLPFWTWSCVAFYQAIQTQKWHHWVCLGLFAGLTLMAKHSAGLLLFSMLLYVICTAHGRNSWRHKGLYLGTLVCFLVVLPNLIWLFKHDFAALFYAADRASIAQMPPSWLDHITHPVYFVLSQIAILLPALFLIGLLCLTQQRYTAFLNKRQWQCIGFIVLLPFVLAVLSSVITGAVLLTRWGVPFFSFLGVIVLGLYRPQISVKQWRYFVCLTVFIFFIMWTAYLVNLIIAPKWGSNRGATLPGKYITIQATKLWEKRFPNHPLKYVDGNRGIAGNISVFSPQHPIALPYFFWDEPIAGSNLLADKADIQQHGVMILYQTYTQMHYHSTDANWVFLGYIPVNYYHRFKQQVYYIAVSARPPQ